MSTKKTGLALKKKTRSHSSNDFREKRTYNTVRGKSQFIKARTENQEKMTPGDNTSLHARWVSSGKTNDPY